MGAHLKECSQSLETKSINHFISIKITEMFPYFPFYMMSYFLYYIYISELRAL